MSALTADERAAIQRRHAARVNIAIREIVGGQSPLDIMAAAPTGESAEVEAAVRDARQIVDAGRAALAATETETDDA